MFYLEIKHLKVRQKCSAARHIFNSLLSVRSCAETLCHMFVTSILLEKNTLKSSIVGALKYKASNKSIFNIKLILQDCKFVAYPSLGSTAIPLGYNRSFVISDKT